MLKRRAGPGGDQQPAKLVAVQGGGVRLLVQPRPPDVGGRGVLEQAFFDGVRVEPGDGAQPPGDGGAGSPAFVQVAGEALDVRGADNEQGSEWARHQVLRVEPAQGRAVNRGLARLE